MKHIKCLLTIEVVLEIEVMGKLVLSFHEVKLGDDTGVTAKTCLADGK
jgi:hypothetical protein